MNLEKALLLGAGCDVISARQRALGDKLDFKQLAVLDPLA
jgi:hypothetical protein